jgi:hypothetical protein
MKVHSEEKTMSDIDDAIATAEHMLKVLKVIKQEGPHPIRQQIVLGCFKPIIKAVGVPNGRVITFDRVVLANLEDIITTFANLSTKVGIPASEMVAAGETDEP